MSRMARYRRCWMEALGGCGGGLTAEHIVSEAVWNQISGAESGVRFGPRLDGSFMDVSVASATISNLCSKHNSGTSQLDAEAGKLYAAVNSYVTTPHSEMRIANGAPTDIQCSIDGAQLHRWASKTFLNMMMHAHVMNGFDGIESAELGSTPLAQYVFNGGPPALHQGICFLRRPLPNGYGSADEPPYLFQPAISPVGDRKDGSTVAFPLFLRIKVHSCEMAVVANVLPIPDDQYLTGATIPLNHMLQNVLIQPPVLSMRAAPVDGPSLHTKLRINFTW